MALNSRSGWGKRKNPRPEDGMKRSPTGRLIVRDMAYLKALHEASSVKPLDLGVPHPGADYDHKIELHHGINPFGGARRDNDAAVVKITSSTHDYIERDRDGFALEKEKAPEMGEWSALHFWAFKHGLLEDPDRGQKFLAWVLERMEEDE